ncbi:MAG: hypothetical protein ACFFDI_21895 [Promethearchaeota archaeon]
MIYFPYIGLTSIALSSILISLFVTELSGRRGFNALAIYIISFLAGGMILLTLSPEIYTVKYNPELEIIIAEASHLWLVMVSLVVLFNGAFFYVISSCREESLVKNTRKALIP